MPFSSFLFLSAGEILLLQDTCTASALLRSLAVSKNQIHVILCFARLSYVSSILRRRFIAVFKAFVPFPISPHVSLLRLLDLCLTNLLPFDTLFVAAIARQHRAVCSMRWHPKGRLAAVEKRPSPSDETHNHWVIAVRPYYPPPLATPLLAVLPVLKALCTLPSAASLPALRTVNEHQMSKRASTGGGGGKLSFTSSRKSSLVSFSASSVRDSLRAPRLLCFELVVPAVPPSPSTHLILWDTVGR